MRNTPRERFELSLPVRGTGSQGRRVGPDFATSAKKQYFQTIQYGKNIKGFKKNFSLSKKNELRS